MFTRTLAEFVVETRAADLPDVAFDAARDGLADVLGCALAGTLEPAARIAADWVRDNGARPVAHVVGRDFATSPELAAFANGIAAHALDFDDSHPSVRGHASASLVPTALAVGEAEGASGEDVLAAYAIGIEVAGKIGRALGHGMMRGGFHPTAIVGTLASTAVAARLSGLDAEALTRAFGIAGSEAAGLVRNFGTMTKPFHAGQAARSGVVAASLASAGFTADTEIFEREGGVFHAYGAEGESPAALAADLGKTWEIVRPGNYVKRWPCCYSNHRAIGALERLVAEHGTTAEEVEGITVAFLPSGDAALVSREPKTGLEGKFSIEYVLAALLLDGELKMTSFTDAAVLRPEAQGLLAKVKRRTIPDGKNYTGLTGYNIVTVRTTRGTFETREDRTPGSFAWPLTEADREAKFLDCASLVPGAAGALALYRLALDCRGLGDVAMLAKAAAPAQFAAPAAA
jgi:2-methylcitrate dehydratase PrpD